MAQSIWDEPTAGQSLLLCGVLTTRGEDGSWPTTRVLTEWLREEDPAADVQVIVDSFPTTGTNAGTRYRAIWLGEDGEIGLTLAAGLLTIDHEIAPYLAMIRLCANRVRSTGPVTMSSTRFHRQFGADHAHHVRTFPAVLRREPLGAAVDITADGDGWTITAGDGFAAYAGVRNLRDYVHRAVDAPEEPAPRKEYVDPALLRELAATRHPASDRLLTLLTELNSNYEAGNPYATLLLHRAVTTGNTEVADMGNLPPPGSLDALVRALIDRG
ncbi:hypothetical protein [Actinophytocola glycyrrhizae]|uniref:Uncharacterized protein n=1 Tax=Actinophytocola glycyrrhizae TaxID=2044873 RepID=A0ABV9S0U9_9PSEU